MEKIDYEVDDFMNYCDYKGLTQKSMKSYGQKIKKCLTSICIRKNIDF